VLEQDEDEDGGGIASIERYGGGDGGVMATSESMYM
jgi:hypothetical protein